MYKKTLVAAMAALVCTAAVFAQETKTANGFDGSRFYGKLSVGRESRTDSWTTSYGSTSSNSDRDASLLVLTPTVGMMLMPDNDNFFLKGLAVEASLGLGFGDEGEEGCIIPRADLVWYVPIPDSSIVPFAHVGMGLPILLKWWTWPDSGPDTHAVNFELGAGLGVLFNVSERVGLFADARFAFGPSSGVAVSLGTRFK